MRQPKHYKAYRARAFLPEERDRVTILFGGVTWKHERLIAAAMRGLGYRVEILPNPTKQDFETGKELVDAGACCPTYFTAGCLVNALRAKIAAEGQDAAADRYAFLTAGGCGACRFGQYDVSYALALENIGLPDLRIIRFDRAKVSTKSTAGAGLDIDVEFTLAVLWAFLCGDLLGDLEYMARPYEVRAGETERVLAESIDLLERAFLERPRQSGRLATTLWFFTSGHFSRVLRNISARWVEIPLDRLRIKPKVQITGEFWLQNHEGQGNYDIKRWLEQEGAEVIPPKVATFADYLLYERQFDLEERQKTPPLLPWKAAALKLMRALYRHAYERLRHALDDLPHALPDQEELVRLAAPYYDFRLNGGEGYMLIGKALLGYRERLAHMVCEITPFGCMPSTMSVGAMANVLGRYPDLLYAPIEVKGDAEIHALSRLQMILTEAKRRAWQEFDQVLIETGLTVERIRAWETAHPDALRFGTKIPHTGAAGTAANYVRYVAKAMRGEAARTGEPLPPTLATDEGTR